MASDSLATGINLIRSYGAVAVVGAGLSMSRYPMTAQLLPLLVHAYDASPADRSVLAERLGVADGPAKGLLFSDEALRVGWEIVHDRGAVRQAFQHAVARHDLDREPTPAHQALARLIHAGVIRYVVSFNWDTAIERAYEQLFGSPLPIVVMAKPHGDAAKPEEHWVLPFQPEEIPAEVADHIRELAEVSPHVLLIIGYSGSDPVVVENLLEPTQRTWPTRRISPSAKGAEGIAATADVALPAIANALDAAGDLPGWLWVTYRQRRDLGAALLGHKLGPQDVDACPQLPEVEIAARHLASASYAEISGESGGGKSLAAYQAARLLNREGWGVVELVSQGVASMETVRAFAGLPGPVVAVVDDSQALEPAVRASFERVADSQHAVLMVSTERSDKPGHSTIRPDQAVATIKQFCLDHKAVISPLVSGVDDRVGGTMSGERYEHRVAAAAFARRPWEFMFTLGGGERRVAESIRGLDELDDGPLLLGLVSVTEHLSLDVGVGVDRLSERVLEVGKDAGWLENTLPALVDRRLVSIRDGRVRTPHMRLAQRALQELCWDTDGQHWERLAGFIAQRFMDRSEPIEGRLWLSSTLSNSESNRRNRDRLFPDEVAREVIDEAALAAAGRDRNLAGDMIHEVGWWHAMSDDLADRAADALIAWLPEMTSADVYGIHQTYIALSGRFESQAQRVRASIRPADLAAIVSRHVDVARGHSWGWLLAGLSDVDEADRPQWCEEFASGIDAGSLVECVVDGVHNSPAGAVEFTHWLSQVAPAASAACIRAITPAMARLLERDMPYAATCMVDWVFGELVSTNYVPEDPEEEDAAWMLIAQAIDDLVRSVDWSAAGKSIGGSDAELHDLDQLHLLGHAIGEHSPDLWSTAMAEVDLDHLDRITQGLWEEPDRVARLTYTLTRGSDPAPGRAWVRRHADKLPYVPAMVAAADPELAIDLLRRGKEVRFDYPGNWSVYAEAVKAIAEIDHATAVAVAQLNEAQLITIFEAPHTHSFSSLDNYLEAIDDLDPTLLDGVLGRLDLNLARRQWTARLDNHETEANIAKMLLDRSSPD